MKKYSDWFKVDLHIHTDYSKKTKQGDYEGDFDIDILKEKLIQNDVKLFSLTDHNIINLPAYLKYYENYVVGDPILLLGCEFDIEVDQEDGRKITYHSLIIFNKTDQESATDISDKLEIHFQEAEEFKRSITIENLIHLFNGLDFFFIPHAGSNKSIISSYRGNIPEAQRMILLMQSALEKVKEQSRQHYNLEFDRLKSLDFQDKDDMPYINFSDNHNCSKYPCTNKDGEDHNFYCIKGIPSYESLRFAFIDPASRIMKFEEVERNRASRNFIEALKIQNNVGVQDVEIYLSPNLNVIIGGRSSGKSLLFNLLGEKSGIQKNDLLKYNFDLGSVQIKTTLDSVFKDSVNFNSGEVIFINQGNIVNFFENEALIELAEESGNKQFYDEAIEKFSVLKANFINVITDFRKAYSDLKDASDNNFTIHGSDLNRILDKSYIFRKELLTNFEGTSVTDALSIINQLENLLVIFRTKTIFNFQEDELETIQNFENLISAKKSILTKKNSIVRTQNSIKILIDSILKNANSTLDARSRDKELARERVGVLVEKTKIVFEKGFKLSENGGKIENFDYCHEEVVKINDDVSIIIEIENDVDIKSLILDGLKDSIFSASIYSNMLLLLSDVVTIKNYTTNTVDNLRKKMGSVLDDILKKFDKPKDSLKYAGGESSKNNSPGFNSEKYIETILKNGMSKIIYIDQPEDNLGNRYIIENLIDIIRNIKFEKQIILVTHNPSIVVYGDAENIVLAENQNNIIKYTQMALEEVTAQREICKVLDGGEYIFNMRAQKYNVRKLLN